MNKELLLINRLINEHKTFVKYLKRIGRSMPNLEKRDEIIQSLSLLEENLNNHIRDEEISLGPLFGKLLMKSIKVEHKEFQRAITKAKSILADSQNDSISQKETLSREIEIYVIIDDILQKLKDHEYLEETILGMIGKVLEEKE